MRLFRSAVARRAFSLLLALTLLFSFTALPALAEGADSPAAQSVEAPLLTEGSYAGYYAISSAEQLNWFRDFVNYRDGMEIPNYSANAVLTADIDLSPYCGPSLNGQCVPWEPFSSYGGKFDGQGHTIFGLYLHPAPYDFSGMPDKMGFFSFLYSATISNLNLKDVFYDQAYNSPCAWIGGIAGFCTGTILTNCNVTGILVFDPEQSPYCGGIVGEAYPNSTITGCSFRGTLRKIEPTTAFSSTIAPLSNPSTSGNGNGIGGICGRIENGTIESCFADVNIVAGKSPYSLGGICGFVNENNVGAPIRNCVSTGSIRCPSNEYCNTGGICGMTWDRIENCVSFCDVSGGTYVGGIAGTVHGSVLNCVFAGTVSAPAAKDCGILFGDLTVGRYGAVAQNLYYPAGNTVLNGDGDSLAEANVAAFDAVGNLSRPIAVNGVLYTTLYDVLENYVTSKNAIGYSYAHWMQSPLYSVPVVDVPAVNRESVAQLEAFYADVYDYDFYLAHQPDVAAAFNADRAALVHHFIASGMAEGRQASAAFNVLIYRANNPDLYDAFGNDLKSYYLHYIRNGKAEGRNAVTAVPITALNGVDYSAVYDPEYYAAAHSDLAAAFGNDSLALLRHFIASGMAEGRQASAAFNVSIYRANNPDIVAAFGDNLKSCYMHYINFGKAEGRNAVTPLPITALDGVDYSAVYDPEYYAAAHSDLAAAFGDDYLALLRHFITSGMAEGRQASAAFDVSIYRANNPDLVAAFGGDLKSCYMHYINCGKAEGRNAVTLVPVSYTVLDGVDYSDVYDPEYYAANHSDLAAAFGDDRAALLRHFVTNGMAEGRQASAAFNVSMYRANNPDLVAAFGDDLKSCYMHYINYGKAEGRNGAMA